MDSNIWKMNKWIRWTLGFLKSGSFDYELPLKYWSPKNDPFSEIHTTKSLNLFFNLYMYNVCCSLLYFVFQNGRVWPLKRLKKLLTTAVLMAGNSSRIHEKIQIHFEISFASLTDSIKHSDWPTNRLIDWLADLLTEWLSGLLSDCLNEWPDDLLTYLTIG